MLRSALITSLMLSVIPTGMVLEPTAAGAVPTYAQATPQTVQVERGGAQIYTQPESNSQIIGEYRAGVVLTPRLRLFNPEGQAWLRIGDHWIAEESVNVLEGGASTPTTTAPPSTPTSASAAAPPAVRPTPIDLPNPTKPSTTSPAKPPQTSAQSPQAAQQTVTKPPAVKPQPKPPAKPKPKSQPKPQAKATTTSNRAVLITKDPNAQVNVRTDTNTQSDVIHAGDAGDSVQILKRQPGEGGFTWYKVKFPVAKVQGWVRGDFIKLK